MVAVRGKEAVLTHAGLHPDLVRRACGRCDSIFYLLVVDTVLLALRFSKFDASFRTLDTLTLGISITCIVNVVYNRTIWQAHRASVLKLSGGSDVESVYGVLLLDRRGRAGLGFEEKTLT